MQANADVDIVGVVNGMLDIIPGEIYLPNIYHAAPALITGNKVLSFGFKIEDYM